MSDLSPTALYELAAPKTPLEVREDFTPSERVAIAEAIRAELGNRQGQRTDKLSENIHEVPTGRTADIAAKKAGFGNENTYRQAKSVTEKGILERVQICPPAGGIK